MDHDVKSCSIFDNKLWSIVDLSKYLTIPVATIRDWVFKEKIPVVRIGRHVRFKPSDIEMWLQEGNSNGHN